MITLQRSAETPEPTVPAPRRGPAQTASPRTELRRAVDPRDRPGICLPRLPAVGISPTRVLVNDPIRGRYRVTMAAFEAGYPDFRGAIVFA